MTLDHNHQLYKLSKTVDWYYLESELSELFAGRTESRYRFMAGALYLKTMYGWSSEQVVEKWLDCPYCRFLCGGEQALALTEFPYAPCLLDIWTRELSGRGYDILTSALLKSVAGNAVLH